MTLKTGIMAGVVSTLKVFKILIVGIFFNTNREKEHGHEMFYFTFSLFKGSCKLSSEFIEVYPVELTAVEPKISIKAVC